MSRNALLAALEERRRLPVLTCERCRHSSPCEGSDLYCFHPETASHRNGDNPQPVAGTPPDWCPWRPGAEDKRTCRENRLAYLAAFGFDGHRCSACDRPPME